MTQGTHGSLLEDGKHRRDPCSLKLSAIGDCFLPGTACARCLDYFPAEHTGSLTQCHIKERAYHTGLIDLDLGVL